MEEFNSKQMKKFLKSAEEKGKPLDPWNTLEIHHLMKRLQEEVEELWENIYPIENMHMDKDLDNAEDECYDVANFAWMVWKRIQKLKEQRIKNEQVGS